MCNALCTFNLLSLPNRYSQLIYLTLIGKRLNLPYLHRDAVLVRLFHSFLSSAPHLVVHLYATFVALYPPQGQFSLDPVSPAVLSALAVSTASVLYTLLSFAVNDRVSGKNRRVILPAHLTQIIWHVCMVSSRVLAFVLFGYIFGYYVVAVIGGHWLFMVFVLLLERTTFCADIERQNNGELKFTRRLCLEIPFDVLAAAVYVFVYFNPKRGRTRVWAGIYHVITLAENTVMGALFYVFVQNSDEFDLPFYVYLPGMVLVVSLYPVGLIFMFAYYLLYHPKRTGKCYWIGIPRKCCACCSGEDQSEEVDVVGTKYQHRNSRVIISAPTLVSHNGFVPKNLLPVGPNATIPNETTATSAGMPNGHVRREQSLTESAVRRGPGAPSSGVGANTSSDGAHDLGNSLTLVSPFSSRTNTARTASESNPAFSDILPSELDTDFSSNNPGEANDTVIDTPLFGTTPEVADVSEAQLTRPRMVSQDTESQKTYTNDTGIDVDSDLQLSPGMMGLEEAGAAAGNVTSPPFGQKDLTLPVFVDVPVKRRKSKGSLEKHYFPNEGDRDTEIPSPDTAATAAIPNRDSVTPTLPTPTYTPSPTALTPNAPRAQWRHPSEGSEDVFHHHNTSSPQIIRRERTPASQPSPDRARKTPRSPIGARSFQVNTDDMDSSQNSQQSTHNMPGPRAVTPRSPKGARRLLIQQPSPVPTSQSRRQPPPPPIPPKVTTLQDTDPPPASMISPPITIATPVENSPQVFGQRRAAPSPPKPLPADGITRGLSSLVPMAPSRRAQSSSPNPTSRQLIAPGLSKARVYHRPNSHTPTTTATPERVPRGVSNYKRVSAAFESRAGGGSLHNIQYHHSPQRPKSEGWRMDRNIVTQPLQQQQRAVRRQSALNSHGSSPERSTFHGSVSSANSVEGYNRQPRHDPRGTRNMDPMRKRSSTAGASQLGSLYYSSQVPRSAFSRISPERSRVHRISSPPGALPDNYPAHSVNTNGQPPSSRSPRHYFKAPQGVLPNAPKLFKSPPPKGGPINVPPPLPPTRRDCGSINEPLTELNSSNIHSLDSNTKRSSGIYDKLPAETMGQGAASVTENTASHMPSAAVNRRSFMLSPSFHTPKSSAHESVV